MILVQKKRSNSIINDINKQIQLNYASDNKLCNRELCEVIQSQPQEGKLKSDILKRLNLNNQSITQQNIIKDKQSPLNDIIKKVKKTPSTSLHTPADFTQTTKHGPSTQNSCRSKLVQQLTKRKNVVDGVTHKISYDKKCVLDYKASLLPGFVTDFRLPFYVGHDRVYESHQDLEQVSLLDCFEKDIDRLNQWKENLRRDMPNFISRRKITTDPQNC